jgi:MoaA/NifB/PqqE/SkfB family radical SAM enzyme
MTDRVSEGGDFDAVRPDTLRVEASSICQLRCPTCPTAEGRIRATLGSSFLTQVAFERLLDSEPSISHVELSNWGEIFTNPELPAILRAAHRRGVALHADNGVHFNVVSRAALDALVQFQFRSLTCSIDGSRPDTYARYRRGGRLENVLANIRDVNALKARRRAPFPRLSWQFVVFGHNEEEIPQARSLARELGMTFRLKLGWDDSFSPVHDSARVRGELGHAATRAEYRKERGVNYMQREICSQLWRSPQVNWDGRVLGCCFNTWGDFGNAFQEGVAGTINGERMVRARRMLRGVALPAAGIPCTTCTHYRAMEEEGAWVTEEEVRRWRPGGWRRLRRLRVRGRNWLARWAPL